MDGGPTTSTPTAPAAQPAQPARAAALLGRTVDGQEPGVADLRWAAGLLHDLVVWGLDAGINDEALRPVETRLVNLAPELVAADPTLATLLDWWVVAVLGRRPSAESDRAGGGQGTRPGIGGGASKQLWHVHPLPDELAAALLPGGWPPNLGADVKLRRYSEDFARLAGMAGTVPVLSQVAKAQAVVREFNTELKLFLSRLEARTVPAGPDAARHLADRAEALLAASGVTDGTPLHGKVRRELEERTARAADLAARAADLAVAHEPLPTARVKQLTKLAKTGDPILAGRLLAALGGAPPRPAPAGLAVAIDSAVAGLGPADAFRAHRLLGRLAGAVAEAGDDKELTTFVDEGRGVEASLTAALTELEPHVTGDAADIPALVRLAIDNGELAEAQGWLGDLTTSVAGERARKEAAKALDRARNRGVSGEPVDALAAAVAAGDTAAMTRLATHVRLLPGMDRKVSALAESGGPSSGGGGTAMATAVVGSTGDGGVAVTITRPARSSVERGFPSALERTMVKKPWPAYVVRVNAHNLFFDGRICSAPAGNRSCASSERFKLDFCEQGVRRCAWLSAFAEQPRIELSDPFLEDYQPLVEEAPPEAGDVAVLWAATETGNEIVGLWRVLTLAPARRGWVMNGDRDAAILLPRGAVPWSAVYRRWSSPRGSQAIRTLDATGLEGLLVEAREALGGLVAEDPTYQRDVAVCEVLLADQRSRQEAAAVAQAPVPAVAGKGKVAARAKTPATPTAADDPVAPGVEDGLAGDGAEDGLVEATNGSGLSATQARRERRKRAKATTLQERLRARGGFYPAALVSQYELALVEAKLIVLAGPSGVGKTRLAHEVADELEAAFCLVAVRPDWHANEDLLGYLPPFPGARFSATPASDFIRRAAIEAEAATAEDRPARPFYLCLDEMNLARPEHYLAELLSKMEIPGGRVAFHTMADPGVEGVSPGGNGAAGFPAEVAYPPNLVIIGTVNLDETTLPISAKILDRAAYLVVEAHELKAYLDSLPEAATVPPWIPRLLVDFDGSLDDAGQGLGYRIAGRLIRWAALGATKGHQPDEALDWALTAQVLPRLRFTRSDPAHLEVLEALIGRLQSAEGNFPRSVAVLERMLAELRRQDFTLGQMRLS